MEKSSTSSFESTGLLKHNHTPKKAAVLGTLYYLLEMKSGQRNIFWMLLNTKSVRNGSTSLYYLCQRDYKIVYLEMELLQDGRLVERLFDCCLCKKCHLFCPPRAWVSLGELG